MGYQEEIMVIMESVPRTELIRLRRLEIRFRAILSYYTDTDLANHLTALHDGGETDNFDKPVRPVWLNHKLVASFRSLQEEMGLR